MIEEREARQRILDAVPLGPTMWVPHVVGLNAFAAEPVIARIDSPVFDNSAMDGYAVRAEEAQTGMTLNVGGVQAAGLDEGLELKNGEAIRVFTGAPIPYGADAVIMQEDVTVSPGGEIAINEGVEVGEFIRRRGGDICSGQCIVSPGDHINPATIGVLASQGFPQMPIHARPMVNILTTGDELVSPGYWLEAGEIYNSNGPMLQAAVEKVGGVPAHFHAVDDPEILRTTLQMLLETGDMLIIAGGVSVGERDFVKATLKELGVTSDFWRVNVKPGKPFLFGQFEDRVSIFGLPGNPVSAFVTFSLFAAPAIRKWMGDKSVNPEDPGLEKRRVFAAEAFQNKGDRPHYLRVKVEGDEVHSMGLQESHAVFGLSRADGLLRLEPEESVSEGQMVTVYAW